MDKLFLHILTAKLMKCIDQAKTMDLIARSNEQATQKQMDKPR